MVKVTGFGQTGPYADPPGLRHPRRGVQRVRRDHPGAADGPPTLPPFGLADGGGALTGAYAALTALYHRTAPGSNGAGQVIDLSLLEPLVGILGPGPSALRPTRDHRAAGTATAPPNNAPRNTYLTKDGRWVAISASATSVAERVMHLVGRPDLVESAMVRLRWGARPQR